jgi:hypothetical protein
MYDRVWSQLLSTAKPLKGESVGEVHEERERGAGEQA